MLAFSTPPGYRRKKITNPKMTAQIISLRNENKSIRAIATMVGVSTATIQRELRKVTHPSC
jgi:transposase-like protein